MDYRVLVGREGGMRGLGGAHGGREGNTRDMSGHLGRSQEGRGTRGDVGRSKMLYGTCPYLRGVSIVLCCFPGG